MAFFWGLVEFGRVVEIDGGVSGFWRQNDEMLKLPTSNFVDFLLERVNASWSHFPNPRLQQPISPFTRLYLIANVNLCFLRLYLYQFNGVDKYPYMDVVDRIPRFKACCIYVPLRAATVIISWFSAIVACLYILVSVVILLSASNRKLESKELYRRPDEDSSYLYCYLRLLSGFVSLVVGSLEIIGINRNKPNYVKIFLIWEGIHLTLEILAALVFANILLLLILALVSYLWLIVFSYYKDICEEKQNVDPTPT